MPSRPHPPKKPIPAATPTITTRIPPESLTRAIDSLLKHLRSHSKSPSDHLLLALTLKKIPHKGTPHSFLIPLPHPLSSSPLLILPTTPKTPLPLKTLPLSDLRSQPSLTDAHDLIIVDRRIVTKVLRIVGPRCAKKVVDVDVGACDLVERVRGVCEGTVIKFGGGTCCVVKVGRAGLGRERLLENVVAAIAGAVGCVPRKWRNVRALHLKTSESIALPVYDAKDLNGVKKVRVVKDEDDGLRINCGGEEDEDESSEEEEDYGSDELGAGYEEMVDIMKRKIIGSKIGEKRRKTS